MWLAPGADSPVPDSQQSLLHCTLYCCRCLRLRTVSVVAILLGVVLEAMRCVCLGQFVHPALSHRPGVSHTQGFHLNLAHSLSALHDACQCTQRRLLGQYDTGRVLTPYARDT